MQFKSIRQSEKGVVLVAVLIVSIAVAALAYTLMVNMLNSLERADVQDAVVKADSLKQGAIDETAYAVKQNPDYLTVPENSGILPQSAGGGTDADIKLELIQDDTGTWQGPWDEFPQQTVRGAKAEFELTAYDYPDLYFVWGDTTEATYEYVDEFEYIRHFYDYHYNPYDQTTDLFIAAGAEVDDGVNDRVFSFGSQVYPADILRFQARQNDAWEPNELDTEPVYFESEHKTYDPNINFRYWTVTYEHDPAHPGRNVNRIDLLTQPGYIALDSSGDIVFTTGWNGSSFDLTATPPNYHQGQKLNATNIFSENINATTLRIGFTSDGLSDFPPFDFGFRMSGIRYFFDTDLYGAHYETPHPYDHLGPMPPWAPGVQVIYSPFQFDSLDPLASTQSMRIVFDWDFYLEAGDTLTLINLAAPDLVSGILASLTLNGGAGQTYFAQRQNTDMPLAIALVLVSDGDNNSSSNNYGYKVSTLEYNDSNNSWITRNDPVIETPHLDSLGSFINPFDPDDTMMYNTVYQPHVPGGGTLTDWFVKFDDGVDLYAAPNTDTDTDYIRITTPGYDPFGIGSDVHYFVNPGGAYGYGSGFLGTLANYHNITQLSGRTYGCGLAAYLEVYAFIDNQDSYWNDSQNWGFRALEVGFHATDASDYANELPTVAAAVSLPPDSGYTNFGSDANNRGEWWITEKDVEMIGVHINLDTFDLDPGDYVEFYDESGELIGHVTYQSFSVEGPDGSGPDGSEVPDGSGPDDGDPDGSGPGEDYAFGSGTIDLNETRGWVLVPGESVHIVLKGDGDDNADHKGFEVDRTAWWSGDVSYDTTGQFERVHDPENDFSDYTVQEARDYLEIR